MDDFLNWDTGEPELSVNELREIGERRKLPDRTLDLMMVLYSHQLDRDLSAYLAHCNQASFWVWESANLTHLHEDFATFERATPNQQRFLGCYVWDFGARAPLPLERLQRQCEVGLEWLKSGPYLRNDLPAELPLRPGVGHGRVAAYVDRRGW